MTAQQRSDYGVGRGRGREGARPPWSMVAGTRVGNMENSRAGTVQNYSHGTCKMLECEETKKPQEHL